MSDATDKKESAKDYYELGLSMRDRGRFDAAIESFTQALNLKHDYNWVHFDLANVLMLQEKIAEAIASYQKAIYFSKTRINGLFYMRIAEAYTKQGLLKETIENYKNALAVDSFPLALKGVVFSRLADIFVDLKKYDQAIEAYEKAIEYNDEFRRSLIVFKLGDLSYSQGYKQKAFDYYEQAIHLNSVASNPILYLSPGEFLIQSNRLDLAVLFYESMVKIAPDSYQCRYKLALVRFQLGQYEDAMSLALQTLEINPSFIQAKRGLAEICKALGLQDAAISISSGSIPFDLIQKYLLKEEDSLSAYISEKNTKDNIQITQVFDSEIVALAPSKTVENHIQSKFLSQESYVKESYVIKLLNGRAYSDFWTSAILTSRNILIPEVSTGFSNLISISKRLPDIHSFFGKVAFLSSRLGSRCYYHWMLEVFPRLQLLRLSGIELNEIDRFLFYQPDTKFCYESLNRLGIPQEKIVDTFNYPHITASELFVPSLPSGCRGSSWVIDFLKRTFLAQSNYAPKERIYISRQKARGRRIINESEVMDILSNYGFKLVFLAG
ncbi:MULTISPECIES: tetratricopeptide repeat protein [unclassified Microcoleus]|uniref:tetratricopeptide repeat protein n=1 Tax=unclassified Microcoleus TaxID=2642155 RepID=UPI002FD55EE3